MSCKRNSHTEKDRVYDGREVIVTISDVLHSQVSLRLQEYTVTLNRADVFGTSSLLRRKTVIP